MGDVATAEPSSGDEEGVDRDKRVRGRASAGGGGGSQQATVSSSHNHGDPAVVSGRPAVGPTRVLRGLHSPRIPHSQRHNVDCQRVGHPPGPQTVGQSHQLPTGEVSEMGRRIEPVGAVWGGEESVPRSCARPPGRRTHVGHSDSVLPLGEAR